MPQLLKKPVAQAEQLQPTSFVKRLPTFSVWSQNVLKAFLSVS
jgi:hypothetical protein